MCSCLLQPKTGVRLLGILFAINLLGLFLFHRPSSIFFTDSWWDAWFPQYLFATALIAMGVFRTSRPQGDK